MVVADANYLVDTLPCSSAVQLYLTHLGTRALHPDLDMKRYLGLKLDLDLDLEWEVELGSYRHSDMLRNQTSPLPLRTGQRLSAVLGVMRAGPLPVDSVLLGLDSVRQSTQQTTVAPAILEPATHFPQLANFVMQRSTPAISCPFELDETDSRIAAQC